MNRRLVAGIPYMELRRELREINMSEANTDDVVPPEVYERHYANREWLQTYLKQDEAALEQLMKETDVRMRTRTCYIGECAELQWRIKDARQRLAAMREEQTRDCARWATSGVLQGVTRSGLWGEVLAGAHHEVLAGADQRLYALKLEDVVVRACGKVRSVYLQRAGNRPAGRWFWSNLDTLEMKLHSFVLLRTVVALMIII